VIAFAVREGRLANNALLPNTPFTVASGGTLAGNGTVGGIAAQSGSIVAPGNSIGTLTVNGDHTGGTNATTISGTGTRPAGPRTQFGSGKWIVGSDIAADHHHAANTIVAVERAVAVSPVTFGELAVARDRADADVSLIPADCRS